MIDRFVLLDFSSSSDSFGCVAVHCGFVLQQATCSDPGTGWKEYLLWFAPGFS
jgi:hypothetical protein